MTINELIRGLENFSDKERDMDVLSKLEDIMDLMGFWTYKVWEREDIESTINDLGYEIDEDDVTTLIGMLKEDRPFECCSGENELLSDYVENYFQNKKIEDVRDSEWETLVVQTLQNIKSVTTKIETALANGDGLPRPRIQPTGKNFSCKTK